jgi:hypothetical protein
MMTMRSHVVTLTAGFWESPVNRDPISVDMQRSWVGFLLPFQIREERVKQKGKLLAWSYREHALLRRAVIALLL